MEELEPLQQSRFVGHDDISAFNVGDPGQSEGWNFGMTLYAWLHGIGLLAGIAGLVLGVILFRSWQRGEIGPGGGGEVNCSLAGDVIGPCTNNSLALINIPAPGLCGPDEVLVNGLYNEKGLVIGGMCVPRDPAVSNANVTCAIGEVLTGPFILIQSGRIIQLGAVCMPLREQVRNTSLDCSVPGQVLTSPFVFDIYGRLTGGTCTTPLGNGTLPDINNGTQTCPPGLFIVGSVVTGSGLVAGPFACISNVSNFGPINSGNLSCPAGYFLNFTLLSDGRGFQGSCVELRLFGEVQGPMNNTQITPVRSAVTCGVLEALAGATYLVSGQVVGGTCVSFVSNATLPVINNATNCTGVDEYALSKVVTDTGLSFHPVCVNVSGGGTFTSLVATANQTTTTNLGGGNWRVGTIQDNDPQADIRWGKIRVGANTAFLTQGPAGGIKLMSFDGNPANGNNLAFYRTASSTFPIGQILNDGTQALTIMANHFYDGTNYRSTYGGIAYPSVSLGNVAGTFVSSPNGILLGFFPTAGAPNTILGSFAETALLTPTATEFYTPTNVKTPLGLFSVYNSILGAQPQIQTFVAGNGNSWLSFGMYVTPGSASLSSGPADNFKLYQFGSSLFVQRVLGTPAGTPVSATTTNVAQFNADGMAMFATGQFNPNAGLAFAPLGAADSAILFNGYAEAGVFRASFTSQPIAVFQQSTGALRLQWSDGAAQGSAPPFRTLMTTSGPLGAIQTDFTQFATSMLIRPPNGFDISNFSMFENDIPSAPQLQLTVENDGDVVSMYFNSYREAVGVNERSSNSAIRPASITKVLDTLFVRLQSGLTPVHGVLPAWNNEIAITTAQSTFRVPLAIASYSTTPQIIISDVTRHIVQSGVTLSSLNGFYQNGSFLVTVPWVGCPNANSVAYQVNWRGNSVTWVFTASTAPFEASCLSGVQTSGIGTLPAIGVPLGIPRICYNQPGQGPSNPLLQYEVCLSGSSISISPISLTNPPAYLQYLAPGIPGVAQYVWPNGMSFTYVQALTPP